MEEAVITTQIGLAAKVAPLYTSHWRFVSREPAMSFTNSACSVLNRRSFASNHSDQIGDRREGSKC